jgi:hypothetical protein
MNFYLTNYSGGYSPWWGMALRDWLRWLNEVFLNLSRGKCREKALVKYQRPPEDKRIMIKLVVVPFQ